MQTRIIALTTDFGLKDPYVAEMKGVILCLCPDARIVDITHEIEKFNVRMGAYVLASVAPFFPKGTIHVVVVDPEVGGHRRPILISTDQSSYVGPDNGTMIMAAQNQGITSIYEINNPAFMSQEVSSTFHGRDIFAPAAAHLAKGAKPEEFGPEVNEAVSAHFDKITRNGKVLVGAVFHIDSFGNIITNISQKEITKAGLKRVIKIELNGCRLELKFSKTYSDARPHEPIVLIGSHNYLEIAINQGNAAKKFKTKAGDKVSVSLT